MHGNWTSANLLRLIDPKSFRTNYHQPGRPVKTIAGAPAGSVLALICAVDRASDAKEERLRADLERQRKS